MEILLLVWINGKEMAGDGVSGVTICEKVRHLFEELDAKAPSTCTGPVKEYFGTRGGLLGLGKGLDYTVLSGMVRLLVGIGTNTLQLMNLPQDSHPPSTSV